jgi:hypothetical protein
MSSLAIQHVSLLERSFADGTRHSRYKIKMSGFRMMYPE